MEDSVFVHELHKLCNFIHGKPPTKCKHYQMLFFVCLNLLHPETRSYEAVKPVSNDHLHWSDNYHYCNTAGVCTLLHVAPDGKTSFWKVTC